MHFEKWTAIGVSLILGLQVAILLCSFLSTSLSPRNIKKSAFRREEGKLAKFTFPSIDLPSPGPMYTWMGEHWIPPQGVRTYTPTDYWSIFGQKDTLWIGDSTGRQDYVSLYNILTSSNLTDISVAELDYGINVNKGLITEPCLAENATDDLDLYLCRNFTKHQNGKRRAFDMARVLCFGNVTDYVLRTQKTLLQDYSVIVFSLGLWNVEYPDLCGNNTVKALVGLLDTIETRLAARSQDLQVVWKIHCDLDIAKQTKHRRHLVDSIHQTTRAWFASSSLSSQNGGNMHVIDLAQEMEKRTYGDARIAGDMRAHLGPSARLLSLQMTAHELMSSL